MNSSAASGPSLQEIEEAETWLTAREWLDRLEALVRANGSDPEMLEAVEYFREVNNDWGLPDDEILLIAERGGAGRVN